MVSALVTGASRGIGRGIAFGLATAGVELTITSRTASDLEILRHELLAAGSPQVVFEAVDLADEDALAGLVELHGEHFSSMDALVVNAGVGTGGDVATFPMRRVQKTVQVNLTSAMRLVQHALPLLRSAAAADPVRGAKIIGLSSITGVYAEHGLAVYGATKAALISFLETVSLEESANGICATSIAPAYVDTDMAAYVSDRIPTTEMIPVSDVVNVVMMLMNLSANSVINRIVVARRGTTGYTA